MEEENFPRGGVTARQESSTQKKPRTKEKTLFRESETPETKKREKKKKVRGGKRLSRHERKTKKIEGTVSGQASHWQPEVLSKNAHPGMLVYGYVNEIQTYNIKMSLPNGLMGTVPITDVSLVYTEMIQQFAAKSETEQDQEGELMTTLSDMFMVGDLLPCKVMECDSCNKDIKLSLNPADINEAMVPGSIRNGMFMYGSIVSQEDHGYTLDLGVKGVQAFLPNNEAEQFIQSRNTGNSLRVGQCVMCCVKKGAKKGAEQSRVVTVSVDPDFLKYALLKDSTDIPFSSLIPGMKVKVTIDKVLDMGITVEFHKLTGSIHVSHLPKAISNYSPGEELNATILYIHPMSKAVVLSCLPYIVNYNGVPGNQFKEVSRGMIFPEAVVKKLNKKGKKGVYFKLDKLTGFASVYNLSDNVEKDNWERGFQKGTTHRCRVIGFFPMEGLVNVTLKKSELERKYMIIDDITPGDLIECHVRKYGKNGLSVTISKGMLGFIPNVHLADVTLRHPEKQFNEGDKLKCRVLSISNDKKMVFLTHKKSLVTTKYPIVTSYEQLKPDMVVEGYISDIKSFGVFVKFFEDIEGFVPKALLSSEPIEFPEKVFYYGQVVRCKVVKVDPAERKLRLTFMIEGKPKGFGHKEADSPEDYAVGHFSKCKVIGKQDKGLDVLLLPSKKKAFLPKQHLSDSLDVCNALMKYYKEKDIIEEVMYYNKSHIVLVTKKPSLLAAAREEEIVTDVDKLQLGMMIPGWVRNTVPYGVFLEFPGKVCGLVPRRYTMDKLVPDQSDMFKYGQTVVAKVIEVDKEKKRFLASLRMLDCYHGDTGVGIGILEHHLGEQQKLQNMLTDKELKNMTVGQICSGTVTQINDLGAVCDLDNGVKAIVLKDNLEGIEVSEGSEFDCVVLYIDVLNNCVEVTLNPQLVTAVRKRLDRNKSDSANQAHVNQEIKCKVVLVKDDFILVSLKGHAAGQLAYLPSKRHYNDFIEKHQFGIGQENPVIVKRIDGHGNILVSLKVHEDKMKTEDDTGISHVPSHSLKIGDIRTAVVKRIHPDQIHISIDGTHGRVHATEVHDEIEDGTLPFKDIRVKSEVKVRVIGFRDTKSWKALPISHPKMKRSCPECSMRPSVLTMKDFPSNYNFAENSLRVGDKVVAYPYNFTGEIMWTHVRPYVQGKVSVLNLTDNEHFFKKPGDRFIPGRGYNATVVKLEENKMVDSYNSTVELSFLEDIATIHEGEVTRGVITSVRPEMGLVFRLPDNVRGAAGLTDLSDGYVDYPTAGYEVGHLVSCFILNYNEEEKRADVSLRKSRIEGIEDIKDPDIRSIEELSEGQIMKGFVTKHTEHGMQVRLGHFINGLVHKSCITDKGKVKSTETVFKIGKLVKAKILSIDTEEKLVKLSMLETDTGVTLDTEIPDHLITQRGRKDSDRDSSSKKSKRKRSISGSSTEHVEPTTSKQPKSSTKTDSKDLKSEKKFLKKHDGKNVGDSVDASNKSVKVKKQRSSDTSDGSDTEMKEEKIRTESKHDKVKKRKSEKLGDKMVEIKNDNVATSPMKKKKIKDGGDEKTKELIHTHKDEGDDEKVDVKVSDPSSMLHLDVSEGFSWSTDFQLPEPSSGQREVSSDESDEEVKKPVKKTKEEIRREKQEEEKRLYEYERRQLEGEISPETADDFDRLVLQSPDSSLIWLRYMAFHLETSEIDKARAVAERALKTISFREEQEKLNVWVAYLNLENMYGSKETLQRVLARAVQQNDATSVYLQMINIYCNSGKIEEAEHLYNILIKKDNLNKDIWVKFGQFYFQNNRLESARKLLQRFLKTLENKHHVETIAKFAQMEFKFGEPERGKTMYENILSTYPKRTDLWSVYIDMVTKHKEIEAARVLYQRVTSLKLSARKMKFFFKKYLEFEEQHGTETMVAEVKQKALDFVEKQGYVDD